ncbi:MAG: D-alanyl-D-alanine carboxypeptidase [Lachnospiraceae bacterium]|nr:D-alanyl-D-alanine carboxypeptidase [Lachnospiraceae bacterium]
MKCTNKAFLFLTSIGCILLLFTGCMSEQYSFVFNRNMASGSYTMVNVAEVNATLSGYTESICVDYGEYKQSDSYILAEAGGFFDITGQEVIYGKNLYQTMNPASLTKVMTALVALKYGNLSDTVVVTENAMVKESGAQTAGFRVGDIMSLEQAINIMMVCSANDAALTVAEHVGGSVGDFVNLMNMEAQRIGATGTHFTNPHGLTDEEHKTTPYDMYLIFNEALKNDTFKAIINQVAYTTQYSDAAGNLKDFSSDSTNLFFKGTYETPSDIMVLGGKTGTTNAAGSCLMIYAKDSNNHYYISVVLNAPDRETVYKDTVSLLALR